MGTIVMASRGPELEHLRERAGQGDEAAREQLLGANWARLRQMVAGRMDRRLGTRCDKRRFSK